MANFQKRLTKWLLKEELDGFLKSEMRILGKAQKDYIVKSLVEKKKDESVTRFAVYTKKPKRSEESIDIRPSLDYARFNDLISLSIGKKREGISIFKTVSNLF